MAKVWVLDTETKGTGAEMVPLEKALRRRRAAQAGARASERRKSRRRRREPAPVGEPTPVKPRQPRRFKIVDVMTRQVLVEGEGARRTLEVLSNVSSVVDVIVYVWDREENGWRPLTMREQKLLWAERGARSRAPNVFSDP